MRELSPEEKELIDSTLRGEDRLTPLHLEEGLRQKPKKRWFFQSLRFWAGVSVTLPLIFALVFLMGIMRAEAFLGAGTLQTLAASNLTPEVEELIRRTGMDWLPMMVRAYEQRALIMGLPLTLGVLLAALLLSVDYLRRSRDDYDEEEDL